MTSQSLPNQVTPPAEISSGRPAPAACLLHCQPPVLADRAGPTAPHADCQGPQRPQHHAQQPTCGTQEGQRVASQQEQKRQACFGRGAEYLCVLVCCVKPMLMQNAMPQTLYSPPKPHSPKHGEGGCCCYQRLCGCCCYKARYECCY